MQGPPVLMVLFVQWLDSSDAAGRVALALEVTTSLHCPEAPVHASRCEIGKDSNMFAFGDNWLMEYGSA